MLNKYFFNIANLKFKINCITSQSDGVHTEQCTHIIIQDQSQNEMNLTKPHVFFVSGGPGSGKGTQCEYLVNEFKFKHISAGELIREQIDKNTPQSQQLKQFVKQGKLISSEIIVRLIKKTIAEHGNRRYLLDGFPRSMQNWEKFKQKFKDQIAIRSLIFFHCEQNVMVERIMERAKTSGRDDDNEETIKKRIQTYQKQTLPIVQYFKKSGSCLQIDASKSKQQIYSATKLKLQQIGVYPPDPPHIFFILGGPGSGKGVQSSLMVKKYGLKHLSTGDLLREQVKKGSKMGLQLNQLMKQGKLVSSQYLVTLIKNKIEDYNYTGKFLIDGFPRNRQNIQAWDKIIGESAKIKAVLYFSCDTQVLKKRLLQRGKTSGRADDNEQTIAKRIDVFEKQTAPLIDHYSGKKLLIQINADRKIQEIFNNVQSVLEKFGLMPRKPKGAKVLLVLGGPGSGKGTQCQKMVSAFGFKHISTGDLLRQQQRNDGLFAQLLSDIIRQGKMVDSDIVVKLIKNKLDRQNVNGVFLLDGFPRNEQNIQKWDQYFGSTLQFTNLINFECSQQELKRRLLQRGKSSGRQDDNQVTIGKRIATFKKQTTPILKKYQSKPNFIININSEKSVEQVFAQLREKLKQASYTQK